MIKRIPQDKLIAVEAVGVGRFPSYRIRILSCTWWYMKCTWRLVIFVNTLLQPLTGHNTDPDVHYKET